VSEDRVPTEVMRLAERRAEARRRGDFAEADDLRDAIRRAGFEVTDSPSGSTVVRRADLGGEPEPEPESVRPEDVPSLLDQPASCDVTIHWLVEGWPQDASRGITSFRAFDRGRSSQHVVVELLDERPEWPPEVDRLRVAPSVGWAGARNAGLKRSRGRVVVIVDGSVEATGDVLTPLIRALDDLTVGVTGPFGIVTDDLREFRPSEGPEVDAVEGYVLAFRRELIEAGVAFDPKFRFYRTADIEFSFQVKARGLRATVTPVPIRRHEHRMWTATPEEERARLSKRNFYRFLDRWRGRTDLLVKPPPPTSPR